MFLHHQGAHCPSCDVFDGVKEMKERQPYKLVWQIQRTLLFWIVGLFNTLLVRPMDVGTWKNWLGWLLLALALLDTISLLIKGITVLYSRPSTVDS